MKVLFLIISIFLLSSPSWSESVDASELTLRDGLFYKIFTYTPFTGSVTGEAQGKVLDGKKMGEWVYYLPNGKLAGISNFKDNVLEGWTEKYYENGNLDLKGNFKDGKQDGFWELYYANGNLEVRKLQKR